LRGGRRECAWRVSKPREGKRGTTTDSGVTRNGGGGKIAGLCTKADLGRGIGDKRKVKKSQDAWG